MTHEKTDWVAIPGTNNMYFANRLGEIKSILFIGGKTRVRILKPVLKEGRYLTINLGSKNRNHYVHRIIAKTFLPNPLNLPAVNHKDFNRENNSVSNLEWVTNSQNSKHAYENGRTGLPKIVSGEKNGNSKLKSKDIKKIRELEGVIPTREIAKKFNITFSYVRNVQKRRKWTHI